ncbi:MAG: hypothetical protein HYX92_16925 [Chloroflexi bacterium]|nr:hypothetical protein [Chloroflexota bacterium]
MALQKRALRKPEDTVALMLRLQALNDPSISEYIAKTRSKYGKHVRPIEEVRRMVDEAMGDKKLTDVLYEMRESGY